MSTIKDLYNGKLYPYEDISPLGIEHRQADAKLEAIYSSLIKKLPPDDVEKIKEWEHLVHSSADMQAYENFLYGFKLGIKLMHEVFSNYPN